MKLVKDFDCPHMSPIVTRVSPLVTPEEYFGSPHVCPLVTFRSPLVKPEQYFGSPQVSPLAKHVSPLVTPEMLFLCPHVSPLMSPEKDSTGAAVWAGTPACQQSMAGAKKACAQCA